MDYTGKKVRIINTNGFDDCSYKFKNLEIYIGETGTIKNDYGINSEYRFTIKFDNNEIENLDCLKGKLNFQLENIELINNTNNTYLIRPPLGVTPKHIYEIQRVQELCRALNDYSHYENSIDNYESMIKWAEELNNRLFDLKLNLEIKE